MRNSAKRAHRLLLLLFLLLLAVKFLCLAVVIIQCWHVLMRNLLAPSVACHTQSERPSNAPSNTHKHLYRYMYIYSYISKLSSDFPSNAGTSRCNSSNLLGRPGAVAYRHAYIHIYKMGKLCTSFDHPHQAVACSILVTAVENMNVLSICFIFVLGQVLRAKIDTHERLLLVIVFWFFFLFCRQVCMCVPVVCRLLFAACRCHTYYFFMLTQKYWITIRTALRNKSGEWGRGVVAEESWASFYLVYLWLRQQNTKCSCCCCF